MQNVIPYFKIFPTRSPKGIILSGGLLLFYLVIPGQALFWGSPALANAVPIELLALKENILFRSNTSISKKIMLPQAIADKIFQDLAQRTNQPTNTFKIKSADATQWPNSCLGLAKPDEFCAQMITPGWRVEVSDGKQSWIYRTDQRGKTVRLEP
jgi:hypothetical protein